jgi:hypothetical protein
MQPIPSDLLVTLKDRIENPTGNWEDFNSVHDLWETMETWSEMGIISVLDLPAEPNCSDYPN